MRLLEKEKERELWTYNLNHSLTIRIYKTRMYKHSYLEKQNVSLADGGASSIFKDVYRLFYGLCHATTRNRFNYYILIIFAENETSHCGNDRSFFPNI